MTQDEFEAEYSLRNLTPCRIKLDEVQKMLWARRAFEKDKAVRDACFRAHKSISLALIDIDEIHHLLEEKQINARKIEGRHNE